MQPKNRKWKTRGQWQQMAEYAFESIELKKNKTPASCFAIDSAYSVSLDLPFLTVAAIFFFKNSLPVMCFVIIFHKFTNMNPLFVQTNEVVVAFMGLDYIEHHDTH